jgi:hypothetical protein
MPLGCSPGHFSVSGSKRVRSLRKDRYWLDPGLQCGRNLWTKGTGSAVPQCDELTRASAPEVRFFRASTSIFGSEKSLGYGVASSFDTKQWEHRTLGAKVCA